MNVTDACWQCTVRHCPTAACFVSECGPYEKCSCACAPNDMACGNDCVSRETPACDNCAGPMFTCEMQSVCAGVCGFGGSIWDGG
jgi:hypothetical protein